MPKEVFLMSQNSKINHRYIYYEEFAGREPDGLMVQWYVYRITHLSLHR
jgi:hypothetical protein